MSTKSQKAMKVRYTVGEQVFHVVNVIICTLLSLAVLLPILNILFGAFSDPYEVMKHSGLFLYPVSPTLYNFSLVFKNPSILTGYLNTIFVVVVGTGLNVLLSIVGAYVLSRKGAMLVKFFTLMIVFTMYFQGGIIPSYIVVESLGLINSRWALILPGACSSWYILVMRNYFRQNIPGEMLESAQLDGASIYSIFWRFVVPLSSPVMITVGVFEAFGYWNSWYYAMLYLGSNHQELFPLQYVLYHLQKNVEFMASNENISGAVMRSLPTESFRMAMVVITVLPILISYPFFRKYFLRGLTVGAIR